ncbi:MAG: hypothetical protein ACRD3R_11240, partial [Terriglobales bacterium]
MEPTSGIVKVVVEMVKAKDVLDTAAASMIAAALSKNFKVKPEEVAIFRLGLGGKQLEFIVPEKLGKVGSIPMSSTQSLAVRTVRDRKPEFLNNFSGQKHSSFFESVK